ncbi:MAG: hypothetical protein AB7T18_07410 [Alphaproteobacteria bacterium]
MEHGSQIGRIAQAMSSGSAMARRISHVSGRSFGRNTGPSADLGRDMERDCRGDHRPSAKAESTVLNDTRYPSAREILIGLTLAFPLLVLAVLVLDSIWD